MKKISRTVRRRRREAKTDYKSRLNLLKSGLPRLVIRKTNKFVTGQIIESEIAQDRVIVSSSSRDLLKKGWPEKNKGSLKSIPAAYLTGLMLGTKYGGGNKLILDIGLHRNRKKSKIYAFLKGASEAGLTINYSEEILPTEKDLLKNEKIGMLIKELKEKLI